MSRALRLLLLALTIVLIAAAPMHSGPVRAIYPLQQVRAGQRAVGKSVFRGTRIESFNMEIIGVLRKFDGTRSVILGRVIDGPVVKRQSGIIAGMSGSPVYINGRLAGAIAYAWIFSKEPIAGITPVEEMLEVWQEKAPAESDTPAAGASLSTPIVVDGKRISRLRLSSGLPAQPDPAGMMTLTPVGGFVQVSGFNQRAVGRLSELLSPFGMQVVQGPGGSEEQLSPPLVPGAAVGAQLVGGDFDMTALGTVTMAEGGRVLVFGHPLLHLGSLDIPMTGGYVYDIMPSLLISNKFMAPTKVVGRVYRDHRCATAGEMAKQADVLPVSIEVTDKEVGHARKFSLRVVRTKELMPMLVALSVMTAIVETRGRIARGTARVWVDIEAEGRRVLKREELGYHERDAAAVALPAVLQPLTTFVDNPLGRLRIERIGIRVEAVGRRQTAAIERLRVPQSRVKAGDEVSLTVTVRPYAEEPVDLPIKLALPPDLPRGPVRVVVSSGREADQARASLQAPRPRPVSLDQLIERYLSQGLSSELVAQAALTRSGVSLLGEELPDLPRSAVNALRATRPTDLRPLPSLLKAVVPTEWALTGRQMVTLLVESPLAPGPPRVEPSKPPEEEEEKGEEEEGEDSGMRSLVSESQASASALSAAQGKGEAPGSEPSKPAKPPEPDKEPKAKPLARAPEAWVHRAERDYAKAKLTGVALREDGLVALALSHRELAQIPAEVVWSVAVRDGVAYVGTGTRGTVYRVSPTGDVSEFFATGEMNVHDLEFDKDGNLWAATSPRGKLFRISPDGKGQAIWDSESTYLWCLVTGPEGTIYAGAGSPGRIYAVSSQGEAKVLAELPAANVLTLVRSDAGELYAGTSDGGVVYRVSSDGSASTVCQVSGTSVDALAKDAGGNVYAAGSPGGDIYRIPPSGLASLWCETGQDTVYGVEALSDGDLVAATGQGGVVIRVGSDRKPESIFRPEAGVATAIAEADGAVYVGSSGPAVLRKFGPGYAESGQLESVVLDAQRTARWGVMEWSAETPTGTAVSAQTRSGDSPDPMDHWSGWAPLMSGAVGSASARYLQYRLILSTKDPKVTPEVRAVRVSRQPENRAPACLVSAPPPGEWIAKKYKVKWQGRDPDKDSLVYEVAISQDSGKTWKELKKDLTEGQYEWDTSETGDGRWLLRVKATDGRSRPDDPRTAEASSLVGVDNTAPKVMIFKTSTQVGEDNRAQAKGMATDAASPIRSVEYRVDDTSWQSLPLPIIESSLSDFQVVTDALPSGSHQLEVRAFDAAGNMASDKVEVKVEAKADAPETAAKEEKGQQTGEGE